MCLVSLCALFAVDTVCLSSWSVSCFTLCTVCCGHVLFEFMECVLFQVHGVCLVSLCALFAVDTFCLSSWSVSCFTLCTVCCGHVLFEFMECVLFHFVHCLLWTRSV